MDLKPEKEPVSEEEEDGMWAEGHLGVSSAKALINTVYYYNGKLFGLRAGEHRSLRLRDIENKIGARCLCYRENRSKTFHGGIKDLKKKCKEIKHLCHKEGDEGHERCLVQVYSKYYELTNSLSSSAEEKAFYFQPHSTELALKNCVMGINSLNAVPISPAYGV